MERSAPSAARDVDHARADCEPSRDCDRCPRLAAFRDEWRRAEPSWHNAPVPSFGDAASAALLVVGLAPGLRGANRTGRPFTGDYAGDLLYETLIQFGFARGEFRASIDDGLTLVDCLIANAVRCVPPQNKPTPAEITNCRPFLQATLSALPRLKVVVALGRIAHETVLRARVLKLSAHPFQHAAVHDIGAGVRLVDSYHCSRYNTNTGVLTPEMFRAVFVEARRLADA